MTGIHRSAEKMKALTYSIFVLLVGASSLCAHPQSHHLREVYKAEGDALFVPLYWLPETRPVVIKHIPDHSNWVGFELGLWKQIDEAEKLKVLDELGAELEKMERSKITATWKRIRDWQALKSQLSLLATFLDMEEGFLDLAFEDPVLRPAFKWITDRRLPDFDTKYIGSTFTSGEVAAFYPVLIEHLLNTPEPKRFECFSRLFARIARDKEIKAD